MQSRNGDAATLSADFSHTCAVREDGSLWCWGHAGAGQLNGVVSEASDVLHVDSDSDWWAVPTGISHTCAIKTDGSLWCWGTGATGHDRGSAVARVGRERWVSIGGGQGYACGIQIDGTLWCWDRNDANQLGTVLRADETCVHEAQPDTPYPCARTPVRVGDAKSWVAVTSGGRSSCAWREDHSLWCWGAPNGPTFQFIDVKMFATDVAFESVDMSTACCVATDGTAFCWVPEERAIEGVGWIALTTSQHHACALDMEGRAFAGREDRSILGDASRDGRGLFALSIDTSWSALSACGGHACGVTGETIRCWGTNGQGSSAMALRCIRLHARRDSSISSWIARRHPS